MNFKEYLEYLLDIRLEVSRYESTVIVQYNSLTDPVGNLLEELDKIINTPNHLLGPKDWFRIGYTLSKYFGKKAVEMVYGVKFEDLVKGISPKGRNRQ